MAWKDAKKIWMSKEYRKAEMSLNTFYLGYLIALSGWLVFGDLAIGDFVLTFLITVTALTPYEIYLYYKVKKELE